jgi:hypothetical protein
MVHSASHQVMKFLGRAEIALLVENEEEVVLAEPADARKLLVLDGLGLDNEQIMLPIAFVESIKSQEVRQGRFLAWHEEASEGGSVFVNIVADMALEEVMEPARRRFS